MVPEINPIVDVGEEDRDQADEEGNDHSDVWREVWWSLLAVLGLRF